MGEVESLLGEIFFCGDILFGWLFLSRVGFFPAAKAMSDVRKSKNAGPVRPFLEERRYALFFSNGLRKVRVKGRGIIKIACISLLERNRRRAS